MTAPQALLTEGDLLSRRLAQLLSAPLERQERLQFYGRSLAYNLLQSLPPAAEQVTRRAGKPLQVRLETDGVGRPELWAVTADGERKSVVSGADFIEQALFVRGRLQPAIAAELLGALHGSEHAATRALAACLKSRSVLEATQKYLQDLLR